MPEIQEDLLKHPDRVEDTIRFVEVRAAGKRSAVTMTTPTTTSAIDEDETGEAITSAYRRQQRRPTTRMGQGTGKATPHPEVTVTPTQAPGAQASHTSQSATPNQRGVCNFCGLQGHGEQERTAHRTAQPSEPLVPHVAGKTIPHRCVGSPLSTKVRCSNNLKESQTWDPQSQPEKTSTSGSPRVPRTSDAMDTHSARRPRTSPPQPWRTPDARAASTAPPSCLVSAPVNLIMHSASGTNLPIMGAALLRIKAQNTCQYTQQ